MAEQPRRAAQVGLVTEASADARRAASVGLMVEATGPRRVYQVGLLVEVTTGAAPPREESLFCQVM